MQRKQRETLTEYVMMAYIHGTLKLNGDKENINVLERRLEPAQPQRVVSLVFWPSHKEAMFRFY